MWHAHGGRAQQGCGIVPVAVDRLDMSMDCSFRDMRLTTHPMGSALWISSNDGRSRCVVIGGIAGKRVRAHPKSWLHVLWFFVHFASQEDWVHEAAQASKS